MRAVALLLFVFLLTTHPARANMAIDVSDETIRVTTGFNGTSLTVFGTQDKAGAVVIVVEGPPRSMTVRKKDRVLGFWTNTDSRKFKKIPAFYEIAATGPLDLITTPDVMRTHRIGVSNLIEEGAEKKDQKSTIFNEALLQMQQDKDLYVQQITPINYPGPLLFKTRFSLPAIVMPGEYRASAYLFQNGDIVDQDSVSFMVVPEGLSAKLRRFATQNGLLYGLTGMLMAVFAGWLATVLLKRE